MTLRFCPAVFLILAEFTGLHAIELTHPTRGPYTVNGSQILDVRGEPFLIRGTRLAPLTGNPTDVDGTDSIFGSLSLTSLVSVRQRLNMSAVRLTLDPTPFLNDAAYRIRANRVVRGANRFELLVILEAPHAPHAFWLLCATQFRDNPDVFFAAPDREAAQTIRSTGAAQPILVPASSFFPQLPQTIYEIDATYAHPSNTDSLPSGVPVLADGLDPNLASTPDCRFFPDDPADATELLERHLADFDRRKISWTISAFVPGRLITDYRYFIGTKLDDGWNCDGAPDPVVGIGLPLLAHLWNTRPDALFTVNSNRGGFEIARGGLATAYGPILAENEMYAELPWPTQLGNVSVRITDARGIARLAPLLYTGAGWANISFYLPEECAPGPAEASIVRTDGSTSRSRIMIADVVPGIWTVPADGRGRAYTAVVDGRLRIAAAGIRFAPRSASIHVFAGFRELKVISFGAAGEPGQDQIVVEAPADLNGETDLYFTIDGVLSNVARIDVGVRK